MDNDKMKTATQIKRRLAKLESEMKRQTDRCMQDGWHSAAGLFWDKRCIERHTLRSVLGLKYRPFNNADAMAGW
jgi:hypothetical protein